MSHFVVYVVHAFAPNVESELERIMAPWDENMDVPEYEKRCWCVGQAARHRAEDAMAAEMGTWADARITFAESKVDEPEPRFGEAWMEWDRKYQKIWERDYWAPRERRTAEILAGYADKESADPKCTGCNGSGHYPSNYNPDSKWDWYVIGGRWDGVLQGPDESKARETHNGFNFDESNHDAAKNTMGVSEYLESGHYRAPYAIVTPDGVWHARGEMGWFGISMDETESEESWRDTARAILEKYPLHAITAVDCHI